MAITAFFICLPVVRDLAFHQAFEQTVNRAQLGIGSALAYPALFQNLDSVGLNDR